MASNRSETRGKRSKKVGTGRGSRRNRCISAARHAPRASNRRLFISVFSSARRALTHSTMTQDGANVDPVLVMRRGRLPLGSVVRGVGGILFLRCSTSIPSAMQISAHPSRRAHIFLVARDARPLPDDSPGDRRRLLDAELLLAGRAL